MKWRKIIFLSLLVSISGLLMGFFTNAPQVGERNLASEPDSINDYALLPCPSEQEFLRLASLVKLEIPDGKYLCDDSVKAKIAKVLHFMNSIQVQMPKGWGGAARETLENPLHYVARMNSALKLDFAQVNSIAQNYRPDRSVYLGGLFFNIDPLFAIAVLIHESRHSDENSPSHERCRYGDIPKTEGGCDEHFGIHSQSGAYAYHTAFEFGLSEYSNLARPDREYMSSLALVHLASRFNYVPESLALPRDILITLDKSGKIYKVHPFTLQAQIIDLPIPADDRVIRIDLNPLNAGVFIFTQKKRLYTWSTTSGFEIPFDNLLGEKMKIVDAEKVYLGSSQHAATFFTTEDNDLMITDTDTKTGARILKKYKERPQDLIQKLITGNGWSGYLHTQDGRVMIMLSLQRGRSRSFYIDYNIFTLPGISWRKIYGGITYDQLFGVGSDGKLYLEGPKVGGGFGARPSELVIERDILKYQEGTGLRMILDIEGNFHAADYSSPALQEFQVQGMNETAVDFVLAREFLLDSSYIAEKKPNDDFLSRCNIESSLLDPVLETGIGIDRSGALVFENSNNDGCMAYYPNGKKLSSSLKFSGAVPTKESRYFSPTSLELFSVEREKILLRPYLANLRKH